MTKKREVFEFYEGFADTVVVKPGMRERIVFDSQTTGFGIRKYYTGKASYIVKYTLGEKQVVILLGEVSTGNLEAMRKRAIEIRQGVRDRRRASYRQGVGADFALDRSAMRQEIIDEVLDEVISYLESLRRRRLTR